MSKFPQATKISDMLASPIQRGERLRILRSMTGLSRKKFAETFSIHYETMKGWETARHGGLSKKGATEIIPLFQGYGIVTSFEWLMFGVGQLPQFSEKRNTEALISANSASKKDTIVDELNFFKERHNNAVDYIICDDSMLPHYREGDYIAGIPLKKSAYATKAISNNCIVQFENGVRAFRHIQKIDTSGKFTLHCLNMDTETENPWIKNATLTLISPVIWHRRPMI